MRTPRLFVDANLRAGGRIRLGGAEAHYIKHVLRFRRGASLVLFNGQGGEYAAIITDTDRSGATVEIDAFSDSDRESALTVRLGLAVIKRDAMDTAIQKATELGATEISPLITAFTDVPAKALAGRRDHWLKVTRSACEQCGRNRPPALARAGEISAWLEATSADVMLIAHPDGRSTIDCLPESASSIALLTGPEGGFSDDEVSRCEARGFEVVSLGPRILRADTATVVLLSLVQARFGDLTMAR